MIRLVARAAALSALLSTTAARAQSSAEAQAEELFQRAQELLAAKRVAEACPLIAESYRLDHAGGSLQNLALCYEELGKWASAYARFQELAAVSREAHPPRPDRVELAEAHITLIRPKLSRLVVRVPEQSGVTLTVDGVVHERVSYGGAGIIIDPGEHVIDVTAPERRAWRGKVTIPEDRADTTLVEVPALVPIAEEPSARPEIEYSTHPTRTPGLITGIVGASALAAGAVFGVLAIAENDRGRDLCTGEGPDFAANGRCFAGSSAWNDANDAKDTARTFATVSTVAVAAGAVMTAAGVWLYLRTGTARRTAPGIGLGTLRLAF